MTIQSLKLPVCRWVALALCGLAIPALAQTTRSGGGGGSYGGGASRSSTGAGAGAGAGSSAASAIERPGNGQVGPANFYVDKDTGQVFIIADDQTTAYVSQVVSNLAKPKPQVLIKVVFLEVDYNKGMDVGVRAR